MQKSTGKMGRGGGCTGKRSINTTPVNNRAASTGRGSGPRGRVGASSASISSPSVSSMKVEESFSLVRENPLNFGMAIKLAPDLVEEIRRVEGQGGSASIKFDTNASNANGNVIRVGDKSFRFTWSREPGDLCDIYEECGNGEDGNGLLVESGGTWRKLNVERELDESTKNHVKRLSEEAEQKLKSRRAIFLDPQNPSMKNQMKAIATVETNPWKNFKPRKEPPSKRPKFEPPTGGLPLSFSKSGLSATPSAKGNFSSGSVLYSHQERHGPPASPAGSGHLLRGYTGTPEVLITQSMDKTATANSDSETHNGLLIDNAHEKSKHTRCTEKKPSNLSGLMISLLLEHHDRGMTVKDLERAVGDAFPNSAWQIEPILKQIAGYQTNGKYFLKPGVERESLNKLPSQSQSSPEINHHQAPEPQAFSKLFSEDPIGAASRAEVMDALGVNLVYTTEDVEKIDILSNSPEHSNEKKVLNNGDGMGGSSDTGSGSESESDSSESDSDSGSHSGSKSRSQRSCSASSTDTRSNASTSSKQASDEDVDIMTSDDDKGSLHKLYESGVASLKSPVDIGVYGRNDAFVSDVVEIERDFPQEGNYALRQAAHFNNEGEEPVAQMRYSADCHAQDEEQVWGKNAHKDRDLELDGIYKYDQPGAHQSSLVDESKSQFDYTHTHFEEKTRNRKRFKSKNSSHPVSGTINSIFGDSPSNSSPDSPVESPERGTLTANETVQNDLNGWMMQPDFSRVIPNSLMSDTRQAGQRSSEACELTDAPSGRKRPGKNETCSLASKFSVKNIQSGEFLGVHKPSNTDASFEDSVAKDRNLSQILGVSRDKQLALPAKARVAGYRTSSHPVSSPENNHSNIDSRSPVIDGQRRVLRRELSDLELGELRETTYDETPIDKMQFERKSPLKQMEKKTMDLGSWNSDMSRQKSYHKSNCDVGKLSPQNQAAVPQSKRKASDNYADNIKPLHKTAQPFHLQHQSLGEHSEVGSSQRVNVPEMSSKARSSDIEMNFGSSRTLHGDNGRKVFINSIVQHHDTVRINGPHVMREIKKQRPVMGLPNCQQESATMTWSYEGGGERKESLDGIVCLYIKYEKAEPELKGPIKNASQYRNYVVEYEVKYESYASLSKILDSYRNEFSKLEKELAANKDRDTKRCDHIQEQVVSLYRQCGKSFKRLKNIFGLLHVELQHMKRMLKEFAASIENR